MSRYVTTKINNAEVKDAFIKMLSEGGFGTFTLELITIRCMNELCKRDIHKAERVFSVAKRHYKRWWLAYGSPTAQRRIQQENLDLLNQEMLKERDNE